VYLGFYYDFACDSVGLDYILSQLSYICGPFATKQHFIKSLAREALRFKRKRLAKELDQQAEILASCYKTAAASWYSPPSPSSPHQKEFNVIHNNDDSDEYDDRAYYYYHQPSRHNIHDDEAIHHEAIHHAEQRLMYAEDAVWLNVFRFSMIES